MDGLAEQVQEIGYVLYSNIALNYVFQGAQGPFSFNLPPAGKLAIAVGLMRMTLEHLNDGDQYKVQTLFSQLMFQIGAWEAVVKVVIISTVLQKSEVVAEIMGSNSGKVVVSLLH